MIECDLLQRINEFTLNATVIKINLLQFLNMITIVILRYRSWKPTI